MLLHRAYFSCRLKWQCLFLPLFIFLPTYSNADSSTALNHLKNVYDIIQDQQGYIWLTGQQGITRFDGNNILTFASHNNEWPTHFTWTHSISTATNNLLVATEGNGLWLFSPKTGESSKLNIKAVSESLYNAIYFKKQYYFYTKVPDNLYKFSPETNTTTLVKNNVSLKNFLQTNKNLYFYNSKGVFKIIDNEVKTFIDIEVKEAIVINNKFIVANKNSLNSYQTDDSAPPPTKVISIQVEQSITAMSAEYGTTNFFTIDVNGLIKKYNQQLEELEHGYVIKSPIRANKIYHDSSGVLWLMSSQGVQRLSANTVKNYPHVFQTKTNAITLATLDNQIILGSYGSGLQRFNKPISNLKNQAFLPENINQFFTKKALLITDLLTIDNNIYISTFDGLWRYQHSSKKLQKVNFKNNDKILLKLSLRKNLLYIATDQNGFMIYDLTKEKIVETIDETAGFSSAEIIDILPLDNSTLWLATAKGLDIFDNRTKTIETIAIESTSKVISLAEANHKIFVATKGDGIFIFNQQKKLLSRIAVGIDFDYIRIINNEIWAPSRQGLYRISPIDHKVTLEPNTEKYSFTSEAIKFEDTVYVGHYGGVLEIPLAPTKQFHPKVFISKTTVSGKYYLQNKSINIQSKNDVITLTLASLDYRSGKDKQYQYKINNGKWNKINGNQLTLTGLASGMYHITIQGTNSLGQWSNYQAFTEINVAYPWYWTPTMKIIYLLGFIALLLLTARLLYLRYRSISQVNQLLSSDLKNRGMSSLNVSRNLNHAIELFENLITKYQKNSPDFDTDMHGLIKTILVDSIKDLTKHSKTTEPDSLFGKTLWLALPFFSDYLRKKYHVNVEVKIDFINNNMSYELQADIYKIIYEALTSAILNGKGRNFSVLLQEFKGKLWITISDDENSFTNYNNVIVFNMAMYYIHQIAHKHKASINTFNDHLSGSQLVISIPLMSIF